MPGMTCDICGGPDAVLAASFLGPISTTSCKTCYLENRVPWFILVGGCFSLTRDTISDWLKPTIAATCKFYNKTEDDLWNEVVKLEQDYKAECDKSLL